MNRSSLGRDLADIFDESERLLGSERVRLNERLQNAEEEEDTEAILAEIERANEHKSRNSKIVLGSTPGETYNFYLPFGVFI